MAQNTPEQQFDPTYDAFAQSNMPFQNTFPLDDNIGAINAEPGEDFAQQFGKSPGSLDLPKSAGSYGSKAEPHTELHEMPARPSTSDNQPMGPSAAYTPLMNQNALSPHVPPPWQSPVTQAVMRPPANATQRSRSSIQPIFHRGGKTLGTLQTPASARVSQPKRARVDKTPIRRAPRHHPNAQNQGLGLFFESPGANIAHNQIEHLPTPSGTPSTAGMQGAMKFNPQLQQHTLVQPGLLPSQNQPQIQHRSLSIGANESPLMAPASSANSQRWEDAQRLYSRRMSQETVEEALDAISDVERRLRRAKDLLRGALDQNPILSGI